MLKFLLILILAIYAFYRAASFLFRFFLGGVSRSHFEQSQRRRAPNSNLNVDRAPKKGATKGDGYSGGEYVDFEEVK